MLFIKSQQLHKWNLWPDDTLTLPSNTRIFHVIYYHGDKKCPYLIRIGLMIINVEKSEATSEWFLNFSYSHISSDFE